MEDIVSRLRVLNFMGPWQEAADEIERLREALLDTFAYVSRADNLFLKESTKNTLKGIPDGHC